MATVNDSTYLTDDTGNRRWWTLTVKKINFNHGLDMKQVWAEVCALWKAGASTYLSAEDQDLINKTNKEYEKADPLKEKVLDWYDWNSVERKWLTATSILEEIGYPRPTRGESTAMGKILIEINAHPGRKSHGLKVHQVPVKILYRNRS